jgi:hypothetical protein
LSKGKPLIGTVRLPYEHVVKLRAAKRSPDPQRTVSPLT